MFFLQKRMSFKANHKKAVFRGEIRIFERVVAGIKWKKRVLDIE